MKSCKKRIVSVFIILMMLASMLPATSSVVLAAGNIVTLTSNGDTGVGTLRQAVLDAEDGDTIIIPAAIGTITLLSVITVDKVVTIKGDTPVTETNTNVARLSPGVTNDFMLRLNSSVKLESLAFEGSLDAENPLKANCNGAIYLNVGGSETVNCRFKHLVANRAGVAIASNSKGVNIKKSFFIENNSLNSNSIVYGGGSYGGSANFEDSLFLNNTSVSAPVFSVGNNNSAILKRVVAIGNKSTGSGSVTTVFAAAGHNSAVAVNCYFYNNQATNEDATSVYAVRSGTGGDGSNKPGTTLYHTTILNSGGGITGKFSARMYNSLVIGNGGGTLDEQVFSTGGTVNSVVYDPVVTIDNSVCSDSANSDPDLRYSIADIYGQNPPALINGRFAAPIAADGVYPLLEMTSLVEQYKICLYDDITGKRRSSPYVTAGAVEAIIPQTKVTNNSDDVDNPADGSLRKVLELAPASSEIVFEQGVNEIVLTAPLTLTKPITIIGSTGASINANNNRMFNAEEGCTSLELKSLILKNASVDGNGAVVSMNGPFTAADCRFINNKATGNGGALYIDKANVSLEKCYFEGNEAVTGGALYITGDTTTTIDALASSCTFYRNKSTGTTNTTGGSAVYYDNGKLRVVNSVLYENIHDNATSRGVILSPTNTAQSLVMVHTTVAKNTKGLYATDNSGRNKLINCIVVGNGDGTKLHTNGNAQIRHGYSGGSSLIEDKSIPEFSFEDIFGEVPVFTDGYLIPLADGPANAVGATCAYLDTGSTAEINSVLYLQDQAGNQRPYIRDTLVTFGSIQVEPRANIAMTVTSSSDVVDDEDGVLTLREAVNSSIPGDTILFGAGISEIILTREIAVCKNLTINGDNPNIPGKQHVILDANSIGRIIYGNGQNSIATNATLDLKDLTFKNGKPVNNQHGGAIYTLTNLNIQNCNFINNSVTGTGNGGAIRADKGGSVLNSVFDNNSVGVGYGGGAIYNANAALTVDKSVFTNNTAGYGGAIFSNTHLNALNSSFTGNTAASATANQGGSAIYANKDGAHVYAINSTFANNKNAATNKGVITSGNAKQSINLYHCTIVGNNADMVNTQPAICGTANAPVRLYNNIIINNGVAADAYESTVAVTLGSNILSGDYADVFDGDTITEGYIYPSITGLAKGATYMTTAPATPYGDWENAIKFDQNGILRTADNTYYGAVNPPDTLFLDSTTKLPLTVLDADSVDVQRSVFNPGDTRDVMIVVALYENENFIRCVSSTAKSITGGERETFAVTINTADRTANSALKVFTFTDLVNVMPVSNVVIFPSK